jgi:uncharacterized tellurite resistance protein B-like protein
MLKEIKTFFTELTSDAKSQAQFGENDYRLAAAALLVHVATLDGSLSEEARTKLHSTLPARSIGRSMTNPVGGSSK